MDANYSIPPASAVTAEERNWAAAAHAGSIVWFFGAVIPVMVFVAQREKSRFVAFHAVQALAYHLFFFLALIAFSFLIPLIVLPILFALTFLTVALDNETLMFILPFGIQLLFIGTFGLIFVGYLLIGLIGTVLLLSGRNFHYPLFGKRFQRYVERPLPMTDSPFPADDRIDQLLAALLHLGAFSSYIGAFNAFIIWATQSKRSAVLRFQGLQATIVQGGVLASMMLFGFGVMFLWFGGIFLFLVLFGIGSAVGAQAGPPPQSLTPLLVGIPLVLALLLYVVVIGGSLLINGLYYLYLGLSVWGSWQVAGGKHYRYPFLGRWLEKRLLASPPSAVNTPAPNPTPG